VDLVGWICRYGWCSLTCVDLRENARRELRDTCLIPSRQSLAFLPLCPSHVPSKITTKSYSMEMATALGSSTAWDWGSMNPCVTRKLIRRRLLMVEFDENGNREVFSWDVIGICMGIVLGKINSSPWNYFVLQNNAWFIVGGAHS